MSAVFRYAIATGVGSADTAAVVKGALRPVVRSRQPAIVELEEARAMLAAVEATPVHHATLLAMRLLALTAVRLGEIAAAAWSELDGDTWRIPAGRMKMRRGHVVPLSRQALDVLDAVRGTTGAGPLIFPNTR